MRALNREINQEHRLCRQRGLDCFSIVYHGDAVSPVNSYLAKAKGVKFR
jgi:hypothetical protein